MCTCIYMHVYVCTRSGHLQFSPCSFTYSDAPPPHPTNTTQLLNEAYEERDTLRQRVGASEDADGTIVVGFGEPAPQASQAPQASAPEQAQAQAATPVVGKEARGEKELVGTGAAASSVNDFED
jgi:hypothetical protein